MLRGDLMSTPEVIGEGPDEVLKLHGHDKETIVQVLRELAELIESGKATVRYLSEQVTQMGPAPGTGTMQAPFFVPGYTWGYKFEVTRPGVASGILDRMVPPPQG
ncbi:hypothetical protein WJ50_10750 [Burkholderia ubonensis]|nr:hypothetical protein WJ48_01545 [Burkholderia ubonensis]KVL76341.1 hypothetical protein WJ49_11605 [Burkholderia ubonensis]KVL92086.1 hypothetical protein WJ50_10750 [Burkholderia ubonensis]